MPWSINRVGSDSKLSCWLWSVGPLGSWELCFWTRRGAPRQVQLKRDRFRCNAYLGINKDLLQSLGDAEQNNLPRGLCHRRFRGFVLVFLKAGHPYGSRHKKAMKACRGGQAMEILQEVFAFLGV